MKKYFDIFENIISYKAKDKVNIKCLDILTTIFVEIVSKIINDNINLKGMSNETKIKYKKLKKMMTFDYMPKIDEFISIVHYLNLDSYIFNLDEE